MSSIGQHDGSGLSVCEATPVQVTSLSTILARSFHPVNPYIRRCIPDTPAIREWFSRVFSDAIADPDCHVLVSPGPDGHDVAGVLLLRLMGPDQKGSGMWTKFDITPDHDAVAFWPMVDGMSETHDRFMHGHPHFLIELLAVDHAYKGRGIGQRLLREASRVSDAAGHDVFVQANTSAEGLYRRHGFVAKEKKTMPGEEGYEEFMLIRPHNVVP